MKSATNAVKGGAAMRKGSAEVDREVVRTRARQFVPVVILLAAGLQIIGSPAARSQDAAAFGKSGDHPNPSGNVETAAPDGQDIQCPDAPCGGAGKGEVREDPEFAQAVKQAREVMGWLMGAGRTESSDQGIPTNPEIMTQCPSPPFDGSGAGGAATQELAGIQPGMDGAGQESAADARTTAGFEEPDHDPVTEWKAALLEESGLLARQSEISESILLMERQVKQAELIARLMEINGPNAAIEIAPGRFKIFRDTPVGRRIAAEMAENGLDSQKRTLELQVEIKRKRAELEDAAVSKPIPSTQEAASAKEAQVRRPVPAPEAALEEIFGTQDRLVAIFRVGGTRMSVIEGDVLPGGALVVAISENSARIEQSGIARTHAINR